MREKTIEKIMGKMENMTMDDIVAYVNSKGNDEEFIINIYLGGGEKDGGEKNREERNRFGIYKACKGQ